MVSGWALALLCVLCPLATAQSLVFNFEISLHVKDEIRQLMEIGTRPARVLASAFTHTRLLDPHDFNGTQSLYFFNMQVFQEAQALYCSFEDGSQNAYVRNNASIPLIYLVNGINCTNCRYGYDIDSTGAPTVLVSRANYDARTRSWYKAAKTQYLTKNTTEMWSAPIFFIVRNVPGVIFTIPLTLPDGEFDGLIALNYDFQDISEYLRSRYENTARLIFIVDHQTGFLLSTSNNASLTLKNNVTGVLDLMPANRSESEIVSGSMKLLQQEPSVEALVIFQGRYIQSTLYTDAERNLLWRIVVIMPANPKTDYVLWTEAAGIGITVLAIVACCVSIGFISWMFYHRNAKLVRMSRVSFVATFLFGCLFLNVSLFFMMGPNTTQMCWLRAWFGPLMMSIAIAPLLLKTWWIYWIFAHPMAPRPPSRSDFEKLSGMAKMKVLATGTSARVVVLVLGEVIILAVGTALDSPAPVVTTTVGADGFYGSHTFCGAPSQPFIWINNLYFAALLFAACFCAFKARNINENLAESRSITVAVYATALFTLAVQIVRGSQKLEIAPDSILSAIGIVWGTTFSTLAVLGPRAFKLATIGDEAACAWLEAGRKPVSSFLSSQPTTQSGDRDSRVSENM